MPSAFFRSPLQQYLVLSTPFFFNLLNTVQAGTQPSPPHPVPRHAGPESDPTTGLIVMGSLAGACLLLAACCYIRRVLQRRRQVDALQERLFNPHEPDTVDLVANRL